MWMRSRKSVFITPHQWVCWWRFCMSLSGPQNDNEPVAFCSLNGYKYLNVGTGFKSHFWWTNVIRCNIIGKMLSYFVLRNLLHYRLGFPHYCYGFNNSSINKTQMNTELYKYSQLWNGYYEIYDNRKWSLKYYMYIH